MTGTHDGECALGVLMAYGLSLIGAVFGHRAGAFWFFAARRSCRPTWPIRPWDDGSRDQHQFKLHRPCSALKRGKR